MPRNRAGYLRRRMRQADNGIERALGYLAEVYHTLRQAGKMELAGECFFYMRFLDAIRQLHLQWYREVWAGTERELWTEGSLRDIISETDPVPDPNYD